MFRKAVILLMLLITPFAQARAVLICSMMNGQIVEQCCCPGHAEHRAPTGHDAPAAACCEVAIEVSDRAFAGISAEQPTIKRLHDVSDAITAAVPAPIVPTFAVAMRPPPPDKADVLAPDRLYLRTARLRL